MKVLIVTAYYPPAEAVGGLRVAKVAAALAAAGHHVHVLTPCLPRESEIERAADSGVTVERFRPALGPREVVQRISARFRRKSAPTLPSGDRSQSDDSVPAQTAMWKRHLFALLWLPDDQQGLIAPAVRRGRALVQEGVQLLYTSGPPFSLHLAGLLLRQPGVRWIAEFRDPWTANPWKPAHVRSAGADAASRWLEAMVLRRADAVVAVTDGIARGLRARLTSTAQAKVVVVRNGIERLYPPGRARHPGPVRIVHVGTFYHKRDPFPFLRALAALRAARGLGPDAVRVILVGNCRWFNGVSVEESVQTLGLTDLVEFHDWMPHEACQDVVASADLLLLLAQDQPTQVPNKLYEYLGTRRPILAVADVAGETGELLQQAGGHYLVAPDDAAGLAQALDQALSHGPAHAAPIAGSDLAGWTTRAQMQLLLRICEAQP